MTLNETCALVVIVLSIAWVMSLAIVAAHIEELSRIEAEKCRTPPACPRGPVPTPLGLIERRQTAATATPTRCSGAD